MGDFIKGCDASKKATKTSIIVVHHCVKNGDIRGSSALFGACDLVHKITRNEDGISFVLESAKLKDGEPVERQTFDMKSHLLFVDNDGDDVTTLTPSLVVKEPPEEDTAPAVKNLSANRMAVWQAIRSRYQAGESTHRRVIPDDVKALGLTTKNFGRWFQNLVGDGDLMEDAQGRLTTSE